MEVTELVEDKQTLSNENDIHQENTTVKKESSKEKQENLVDIMGDGWLQELNHDKRIEKLMDKSGCKAPEIKSVDDIIETDNVCDDKNKKNNE